jgi:hypothetical protein
MAGRYMNKRIGLWCFFWAMLSQSSAFSEELLRTEYEERLISHVQQSIANAEKGISSLTSEILSLQGMSSSKVRHFLNNVCSFPNTRYLEIGTWAGSTWISALYGNFLNVSFALAIDNWSEFGGPVGKFRKNCQRFLQNYSYQFLEANCFRVNLNAAFKTPISVYFYDGAHDALSQEKAFTYYNSIFDEVFVAIVDDWNWDSVQKGTMKAFALLSYEILFEAKLPAKLTGDLDAWWNGLYVAVIRKNSRK